MPWIKKGDLLRVNGKIVVADSDDYTRLVYDDIDYEIMRYGGPGGSAVGCVRVLHTDTGAVQTVRFDNAKIEKVDTQAV